MGQKFELDWDLIDKITVESLIQHRKILKQELKMHKKGTRKLHSEDQAHNLEMIEHMSAVIEYYGGL